MRKAKANAQSVVEKWAQDLKDEADNLANQVALLRKAAEALEKGVTKDFVPTRRDRDGETVVHP
jgi:hypothetical protein